MRKCKIIINVQQVMVSQLSQYAITACYARLSHGLQWCTGEQSCNNFFANRPRQHSLTTRHFTNRSLSLSSDDLSQKLHVGYPSFIHVPDSRRCALCMEHQQVVACIYRRQRIARLWVCSKPMHGIDLSPVAHISQDRVTSRRTQRASHPSPFLTKSIVDGCCFGYIKSKTSDIYWSQAAWM